MYTVELDLHLRFVPPMHEHGGPIILTRAISLPFPPHENLVIFGKEIDTCPEPEGFSLGNVIWDLDRGIFLATVELTDNDCPFQDIPRVIQSWIERGWRFGSYRDYYAQPDPSPTKDTDAPEPEEVELPGNLQEIRASKRPKEFNRVFKALIRHFAEGYELSVAYAMDKTGMYFPEPDPVTWNVRTAPPYQVRFKTATHEFGKLPEDEQNVHRERWVRYRSLEYLVRRLESPNA